MSASQAPLLTPADHVKLLHPGKGGGIPLVVVSADGQWGERVVKRSDAEGVADHYLGVENVYVGQQAMRGRRRVRGLHGLGTLYLDLDTRNVPGLSGVCPEDVCSLVLERTAALGMPLPTLVMFSGRGLAVTWAHGLMPPRALPRWQAVQDHLVAAFRDLGADGAVRDAARVLRLVGSVHGGTGETVRPLHVGERSCFEAMALALLPRTREEVAELRAAAARRKAERRARGESRGPAHSVRLSRTSWAQTLLEDLHRLHAHRYGRGIVPKGSRDLWHLAFSVAAVWLDDVPAARERVGELGRLVGRPPETAIRKKGSVIRRAEEAARGGTTETRGRRRDPRYTPRSSTVMAWLGIDEGEARDAGLRMLVTPGLKREHERARWHTRRAARGGVSQASLIEAAAARAAEASGLRASGLSWPEVAARMGMPSAGAARKLAERGAARLERKTVGNAAVRTDRKSAGTATGPTTGRAIGHAPARRSPRESRTGDGSIEDTVLLGASGTARTRGAQETFRPVREGPGDGKCAPGAEVIPFGKGGKPPAARTSRPSVGASGSGKGRTGGQVVPLRARVAHPSAPGAIPAPPPVPCPWLNAAMGRAMAVAERVAVDRAVTVESLRKANRAVRKALVGLRDVMDEDEWDVLDARVQSWWKRVWTTSRALREPLPRKRFTW